MMMRSDKKASRDIYLYDSIGSDKEGNEISLIDIIEYEDEDVAERVTMQDNIAKLGKIIDKTLTPREKDIIIMRYGLGGGEEKTQREIALKYGISRSYVSRIEKMPSSILAATVPSSPANIIFWPSLPADILASSSTVSNVSGDTTINFDW